MEDNKNNEGVPSNMQRSFIKCLTDCTKGTEITVLSVNAGKNTKNRLANLGILPGTIIVKKRTAPFSGPIEVIVKGTSLVLGRGIAAKIIVDCGKTCEK